MTQVKRDALRLLRAIDETRAHGQEGAGLTPPGLLTRPG
jgi:hypothetical protein